jgi:hypothetical protein
MENPTNRVASGLRWHLVVATSEGVLAVRMERQHAYDLFGVPPGAPVERIRREYRQRVMSWHPDRLSRATPDIRAQATTYLQELNAAYQYLTLPAPRWPRSGRQEPVPVGSARAWCRRLRPGAMPLPRSFSPLLVLVLVLVLLDAALVLAVLQN